MPMWRSLAGQVKVFSGHLVNACDSMNFMASFSVIDSSEQPSKAPQAITSMVQFVSPLDTLYGILTCFRFGSIHRCTVASPWYVSAVYDTIPYCIGPEMKYGRLR